jgi:Fibronectin type III domain
MKFTPSFHAQVERNRTRLKVLVFLALSTATVALGQKHSADFDPPDGDWKISLTELMRVVELYNTRYGTTRTGAYKVDTASPTIHPDGFLSDPSRTPTDTTPLSKYHSGDSSLNAKFSLTELLRVIELYNYYTGTERTGEYHVEAGTEDGFAPGPALVTAPSAPSALSATGNTTSSFTAIWTSVSGASSYRLDVSTVVTFASFVSGYNNLDVGNTTSSSVSGLGGGSTYYYRVRATNVSGSSSNSNTVTTQAISYSPGTTIAYGITNLTAISFTASWSSSLGATNYRLDVSTDNFTTFVSGFNGMDVGDVTSYNVTGLTSGVTYYFRVRAENLGGQSASSTTQSRATLTTFWHDRNGDGILDEHIPNLAGGYAYHVDDAGTNYEVWEPAVDAYYSWVLEWATPYDADGFTWYFFPAAWQYAPPPGGTHPYVRSFHTFVAEPKQAYEIWELSGINLPLDPGYWGKQWGEFVYETLHEVGVHFSRDPDYFRTSLFYLLKMGKPIDRIDISDSTRVLVADAPAGDAGDFSQVLLPVNNQVNIELKNQHGGSIPSTPHAVAWQIKSILGAVLRMGTGTLVDFDGLYLGNLKLFVTLDAAAPKVFNIKTNKIQIIDKNGANVTNLHVAKMSEYTTIFEQGSPITIDPDYDSDRFYIKIIDPASRGTNPKIAVWTDSDDDLTLSRNQIQLADDPSDPTALISASMILVIDDVDDQYASLFPITTIADGNLGDRTRKAKLGDKLSVEYLVGKTNPAKVADSQATVPILSTTINIIPKILNNSAGSPFVDISQVLADLELAKQCFAQVGVLLRWDPPVTVNAPSGISATTGRVKVYDTLLGYTSTPDGQAMVTGAGTTGTDTDIHVFYVNQLREDETDINGFAYRKSFFSSLVVDGQYTYNAFLAKDAGPFTLAHELVHLLADMGHDSTRIIMLMHGGGTSATNEKIYDTKRLQPANQTAIINDSHTTE